MALSRRWMVLLSCVWLSPWLSACDGVTSTPVSGTGGSAQGGGGGAGGIDEPCLPPEVEHEGECLAAGVGTCAAGFVSDALGGCRPVLPESPCADGEVASFGDTSCRPIVDCGSTTWANIPEETTAEHVDPAYPGKDSDGSREHPWTTVAEAINAADDGDFIALAAGDYGVPPSLLSKRLRIWGRCPSMVAMTTGSLGDSLFINTDGTEVHQVSITGESHSIVVADAEEVLLDRLWLHDTTDVALLVTSLSQPTKAVLRDSLVERGAVIGIAAISADLDVEGSIVRDTVENSLGPGRGIDVELDPMSGIVPTVNIRNTLVQRARETGVACLGANCSLEDVAIVDTAPQNDGRFGMGVAVQYAAGTSSAELERVYIGGAYMFGISAIDATLRIADTTIEDVQTQVAGDDFGDGIAFVDARALGVSASVLRSRVSEAARAGIASFSGRVELGHSALGCNTIHLDGEMLLSRPHDFQNVGPNLCFCGGEVDVCKVLESQLQPPPGF